MCCAQAETTQRLFFALWPGAAVRSAMDHLAHRQVRKLAKRTPAANLHITLAFPGQVGAGVRDCLEQAADRLSGRSFTLQLDQVGHWPRPRIIWAGPTHTPPELWSLVEQLRAALEGCGITPETRPFQAHVTLARKASRRATGKKIESIDWPVDDFCLAESITDSVGPVYRVLRTWALEGQ